MDYEILQKIKRHRNQRIYRVFCGCFFEFQKIATTPLWKTNFVCMFHARDALARLSYVAVHRSAQDSVSTCGVCVCERQLYANKFACLSFAYTKCFTPSDAVIKTQTKYRRRQTLFLWNIHAKFYSQIGEI